nr:MAG TPA: hypothetical protein [Myoviridae sp. ctNPX13]
MPPAFCIVKSPLLINILCFKSYHRVMLTSI